MNKKHPNLLLIGPALGGGGAEGRFKNLCTHLFDGNIDAAVLLGKYSSKQNKQLFVDLKWKGPLSVFRVTLAVRHLIFQQNYTVIMSFGFYPNVITWMALIGVKNRPKLIFNEITRPWTESNSANLARRFLYRFARKIAYPQCDKLLANSMDGIDECVRYFGVNSKNTQLVSNLIDTQRIKNLIAVDTREPIKFGRYLIVLSRLDPIKGIDLVLQAFSMLSKEIECGIVVVGDGIERQKLQNLAIELDIDKRVLFTGMLENPFPILANASALVMASKYEGFSNTVLEAMFCNVPVITNYYNSDAVDMCKKNVALGYDINDLTSLTRCMEQLLLSNSLAQQLVTNAVLYRENHSVNKGVINYARAIIDVTDTVSFN